MNDDDLDIARGILWACVAGVCVYAAAVIAWLLA